MSSPLSRRAWLAASAGVSAACAAPRFRPERGAVVIASHNGLRCVADAYRRVQEGARPVYAAVHAVAINEDDPDDMTVGYGGLPNEEGVVQLDAACMDGPSANAGAVAALEGIKNPAQVAYYVMEHTDHVLLVGAGAKRFALSYGFREEDLLTDKARQAWLRWRAARGSGDDWLAPVDGELQLDGAGRPYGTIHCSVLDARGDLGCTTTTSGLAFKLPGRVGDSPLIGCGLYCDNEIGSAGGTGRGEANILSGGSWLVVERMRAGDEPTAACEHALQRVVDNARRQSRWQPALWAGDRPAFDLTLYALRKDGRYGCASIRAPQGERRFAVCDAAGARHEPASVLYAD